MSKETELFAKELRFAYDNKGGWNAEDAVQLASSGINRTSMLDRQSFYDSRARFRPAEQQRTYNTLLRHYYRFFVPPNARVLEIGCGIGDLLAATRPACGVGIDFSPEAIALARGRHPELRFICSSAEESSLDEKFDYIILSDLVNDLNDVQAVLERARRFSHERTRLVITTTSISVAAAKTSPQLRMPRAAIRSRRATGAPVVPASSISW